MGAGSAGRGPRLCLRAVAAPVATLARAPRAGTSVPGRAQGAGGRVRGAECRVSWGKKVSLVSQVPFMHQLVAASLGATVTETPPAPASSHSPGGVPAARRGAELNLQVARSVEGTFSPSSVNGFSLDPVFGKVTRLLGGCDCVGCVGCLWIENFPLREPSGFIPTFK